MSQVKTLNGVQYTLPQYNDINWGANTGQVLTQYIAAIADCTLQLTGGAFTLTADVDFGANFGVKALFVKSETTNPASAGVLRLAKTDAVKWRNNANSADVSLAIDGSDNLTYSGTKVIISGAIVNADVAAGAAIAVNKLAALGVSLVPVTDASGFLTTSGVTTTPTELNFVHGVTSAIQTQLNTKATDTTVVHNTGTETVAGAKTFTSPIKSSIGTIPLTLDATATTTQVGSNYDLGAIPVSANTSAAVSFLCPTTNAQILFSTSDVANAAPATRATIQSPAQGGCQFVGTTAGNTIAAGQIGERIASAVAGVNAPTAAQYGDITSILLTAGEWDVSMMVGWNASSGTTVGAGVVDIDGGISSTVGNNGTGLNLGDNLSWAAFSNGSSVVTGVGTLYVVNFRVSITASTTYYLKLRIGSYGGTVPTLAGRLSGRRVA